VLSTTLAGLLAGGMLFIEVVLLPFWRGMPPADFRRWFAAHADRIRSLMIPLGVGAGVTGVASAVADVVAHRPSGSRSVVAAATTVGVVAITVAVNEPINHRFVDADLTDTETERLLRTWAGWHHVRVALGLAAAAAAASALPRRTR
jgi:uncharacterized membrane protein